MATVNMAKLPLKHKLPGALLPENLGLLFSFWRDGKGGWVSPYALLYNTSKLTSASSVM